MMDMRVEERQLLRSHCIIVALALCFMLTSMSEQD